MTVRAVTPQVTALGGGLQFWRDLDGYDLAQDSRWDEVAGGDFYPDPKLDDFSSPRGSYARRARGVPQRVEPSPMQGSADHRVGLDGRSALPTSSALGGSGAGTPRNPAAGALGGPRVTPGTGTSSSAGAGPRATTDVSSARREPGAA